jgi:endoglucanase
MMDCKSIDSFRFTPGLLLLGVSLFAACDSGSGRAVDGDGNRRETDSDSDTSVETPPMAAGFLHVEGNRLLDDDGNEARLTGVNWFGFETSNQVPHGLWSRDYRSMLRQITDLGFNTVRLPWSNAILGDDAQASSVNTYGPDPYDGTDPMNGDLEGKSPLEILDAVIDAAKALGLKVILDNHSRRPDGYMAEELWYTSDVSEAQWIADWVFLAGRYLGDTAVVAFDLNNEPHGAATWGAGDSATDWNIAAERCANAVLEVNPNALIVVEGVETVGGEGYWWGGNLKGVASHPLDVILPEKLVYSAHEYGPEVFAQDWFSSSSFPGNMERIWYDHFGFLMDDERGHVLIGEFGIRDKAAFEGRAGVWFETFMEYLGDRYSWTFWCLNPNSGDTGGVLQDDWLTPVQWKMDALSPELAPFIE